MPCSIALVALRHGGLRQIPPTVVAAVLAPFGLVLLALYLAAGRRL